MAYDFELAGPTPAGICCPRLATGHRTPDLHGGSRHEQDAHADERRVGVGSVLGRARPPPRRTRPALPVARPSGPAARRRRRGAPTGRRTAARRPTLPRGPSPPEGGRGPGAGARADVLPVG